MAIFESACPNSQASAAEVQKAIADLATINEADAARNDPELVKSNAEVLIANLEQVCGTNFSAAETAALTRAAVEMSR